LPEGGIVAALVGGGELQQRPGFEGRGASCSSDNAETTPAASQRIMPASPRRMLP
jgi:hypothetical protein